MEDNKLCCASEVSAEMQVKIDKLPKYSEREDRMNTISHGIGVIMSVIGLIVMLALSIKNTIADSKYFVDIISSVVFGCSLILLYSNSALYHGEKNQVKRVRRQKFDHLSINILIAGSVTAYLISGMAFSEDSIVGYIMIGVIWGLSIFNMILNLIDVKKYRTVSMIIYVLTGWAPVFIVSYLIAATGWPCFALLLAGGLFYTIGIIFYRIKKQYMHAIWHLFVLMGSLLHIVSVSVYIFAR